ncbi:MAG: SulP family inorganic anion transporter [Chloroflexi bacterium]|nr:SulP family inorganic anion transporter [Chloroflexota bacterium]MYE39803.1 SulP family inorganic anion transporter [Chloroflexota bacterium]
MATFNWFLSVRSPAALRNRINYRLSDLRGDVFGGITAGSIVLPFAMGYGVLSGLGPVAGLHGAVAVGIFASLFGGTRGLVYGPNTSVTIVMGVVVAEYADSLAEAATIGVLAGLIQLVFGLLGLGRYAAYIPSSLVSGFFTAFGVLIIIKQVFPALGLTTPPGGVSESVSELPAAAMNVNFEALALTAVCLGVAFLWRGRFLRVSPAPFAALVLGTLAGVLLLRDVPAIGEVPSGLPSFQLSAISLDFFLRAAQPAFIMALLASVQTFMWALRVDAITGTQHKPNREMFAQGIGNTAAGLTGGLAGSVAPGAIPNALSGGRSPIAGLIVAGLVLASILFLGPVVERVPLAVLAAIVMVTGWNLIDLKFLKRVHRIPRSYALVMLLTLVLALFAGLTLALVIGLVVAALTGSRRLEALETAAVVSVPLLDRAVLEDEDWDDEDDPFQARTGLIVFPDRVTVASARELSRILRLDIRGHQYTIFDMSRTVYLDDSAAVMMGELTGMAMARQSRTIVVAGMSQSVSDTVHSMGALDRVPAGNFAADVEEAKQIIRPLLLVYRQGS